jgi:predicted nucleic acid-binding Zn ribbon protein
MTLKEAIESGKPYQIEGSGNAPSDWKYPYQANWEYPPHGYKFTTEEVMSTKWILKYDCETCKDTKEIRRWQRHDKDAKEDCPDCSTPKYKCKFCEDTGKVLAGHVKDGIVLGSWEQTCPKCKGVTPKYKCDTCKDTKKVLGFPKDQPCPDCSAPPKMKKITVYRAILLYKNGHYEVSDAFAHKDYWQLGKEYQNSFRCVGFKEEEIEVLDEEASK